MSSNSVLDSAREKVARKATTELSKEEQSALVRQSIVDQPPAKIDEDGDECVLGDRDGETVYLKKKHLLASLDA